MDLEKAYDRVDREALWRVLRLCGVGGTRDVKWEGTRGMGHR